jgi:hypothetical protein
VLVTVFANGIPSAAFLTGPPGIAVTEPDGRVISDGGIRNMAAALALPGRAVFKITNPGTTNLTGFPITKDGADAGNFTLTVNPIAPVAAGASANFTIEFAPTTTGAKSAAFHIASNVLGNNPYDFLVSGQVLSGTTDTDGDGMSDLSEFLLASLGFDWQVSQPALVQTYYANANAAGLYTPSQVQALNVGVPLIQRNPTTGTFTLTIGVMKSANLSLPFADFPMNAPGTSTIINGQGELEFQFTVPDNAAFFRLESH